MKNLLDFKMQLASAFAVAISEPFASHNEAHFVVLETTTPEFAIVHKITNDRSDVVLFNTYEADDKQNLGLLILDAGAMGSDVAIRQFVDVGLKDWASDLEITGLTISDTLDDDTLRRIKAFSEVLSAELPQKVVWMSCSDGGTMMWLAIQAKADEKKLLGAAADCARLVLHRAGRSKEPGKAIETVRAYSMGLASAEELKTAIEANDRLTVEVECQESKFDATLGASCKPECVVQNVVNSAVSEARNDGELYRELPSNAVKAAENAVRAFVLTACANIIRTRIELTPILEAEIGRHNNTRTPWA